MSDTKDGVRERLDEIENDWKVLVNRLGRTEATLDELHRNYEALEGATMDAITSMRGESGELKARDDYGEDEHLTDVAGGLDHAASELEAALENPPGNSFLETRDEHWADPCYLVENNRGDYVAHTGNPSLIHSLVAELDEMDPEEAPHRYRETTFHEVNGTGPYTTSGSQNASFGEDSQ